ncbi:ribosomal protein S18 acetylase RimI-like enzyme [Peribacillus deserti]|uniref:Ribosomal protein S18 acetylase RimI-like enzyme n=1 Tax=Peribacillus deserti TaxID=673318 RepID=A0ABS2QFT9_9BACI|nr:GNAT family N-acetyltransferase [Peribacillus deserti]MBM7691166.1 ribosomal protein S18 acetylase RimI-like enzyme [Peribacillus deserti]
MGNIMEAAVSDSSEILTLQKKAFLSEAELLGNYDIKPLHETILYVEKAFQLNTVLKFVVNGQIVGSVRAFEKEGTCYISKLMVHPEHQNKGIGRELMLHIESMFPEVRYELITVKKCAKNISFYEKLGYKGYKTKKLEGEEALFLCMEKKRH